MSPRDEAIELGKEAILKRRCPGWIAPEDVTLATGWARDVVDALAQAGMLKDEPDRTGRKVPTHVAPTLLTPPL